MEEIAADETLAPLGQREYNQRATSSSSIQFGREYFIHPPHPEATATNCHPTEMGSLSWRRNCNVRASV